MKFWRGRKDAELDAEIRSHLDEAIRDRIARGESPDEARANALREFGNVGLIKEVTREMWGWASLERLGQDLRFGLRRLRKQPSFTLIAAVTLALGIGANAALFSIVNGVLLNPLPYPQPGQLVTLHQSKPNFPTGTIPYLNFQDWQTENQTFAGMAIFRSASFSLLGTGEAEQVDGQRVSAEFFAALGVKPMLGRDFTTGEDERGAGPVVLISAALWRRKFNSAADVVGKSLTVDDKNYTIIGVLPASFRLFRRADDVFVPIGQWDHPALRNRQAGFGLRGIGRLKPGVTHAQAQADLDGVMRRLAETYPDANRGNGAAVAPLKETLVGEVRLILWLLFGAVGFVLLIACVNVSNLLLARATGQRREFAIRAALGAGRGRLARQSLTESALLAGLGGALGLPLAAWGTQAALSVLPTALPRAEEIKLDARVLLFTFAIALLTGAMAGLTPALKIAPQRLSEMLKEGGRGAHGGSGRAHSVLVTVEMALALVLLIGAGLMIRSLSALWDVDPGFRPDNALTFGLRFPPAWRTNNPETVRASLRQLSDNLNAAPGIKAASFTAGAAPLQSEDDLYFWRDDRPRPASTSEMNQSLVYQVEPAYLTAMGIPLKQGRFFSDQDNERSPNVAVVDETFASKFFPGEDPLGKRINMEGAREPFQIIGVTGHVKQWSLDADDQQSLRAQLYLAFRQLSIPPGVSVVVRTEGAAGTAVFDTLRHVIQNHHNQNVMFSLQTMNQVIADSLVRRRFSMILLNAFAVVALLLASVGLYGVISYLVGQRTQEIGVRMALGAQRRDVLLLVLRHGMKTALSGVALGLVAALGLTRLLATMLYGVRAIDPATFAAVALLLTVVALVACWIPARRATTVDPLIALRHE